MYNQLDIEEDEYEFEKIVDHYFKNGVLLLNVRYIGDTLGEQNIAEVPFKILKKYLPIELARYVKNYVAEASRQKCIYNICSTEVLNGNTRYTKCIFTMKEIYRGYRIVPARRDKKNAPEAKYNMLRALKTKPSRNQRNKMIMVREKLVSKYLTVPYRDL